MLKSCKFKSIDMIEIEIILEISRLKQLNKRLEQLKGMNEKILVIERNNIEQQIIRVKEKIDVLNHEEKNILELIEELENPIEKAIIQYKLLESKSWEELADKIGYSSIQCKRIYNKIKEKLK